MARTNIEVEFIRFRNEVEEWMDSINERQESEIPIYHKVLLTVDEASILFNLGVKKIYQLANSPADFVLKVGNKILIKRRRFEEFLERSIEI